MGTTHLSGINLKFTAVNEGVAGNFTVAGISTDDVLIAVIAWKLTLSEATPNTIAFAGQNVTSEFTITSANTINNGGGTSLADCAVLCVWLDVDAT